MGDRKGAPVQVEKIFCGEGIAKKETLQMWKAIVLAIGAYIITLLVTALAALFVMTVMAPRGCGDLSRALLVMWLVIAAIFVASGVAVGVGAWQLAPDQVGRVILVTLYGVVLLASYSVVAFGLMLALNC